MSTKYTGGFITKNPVAPTSSAASGIWTLDQQQQAQKAGTWPSPPIFIEDLFSTYLYTGNGSTQTITNGIDLAGKGGLVWIKDRTTGGTSYENALTDTVRGATNEIQSDTTAAQTTNAARLTSFNSNGFSIGNSVRYNQNTDNYVSWTFAEQPKFFDVVTYTGNGTSQTISHNLGSTPGCIIVKQTSNTSNWMVYHTSLANTEALFLNLTNAKATGSSAWNSTTPTSTVFSVGANSNVNASGESYVAYLWANNAGGFPVSGGGSTNGISCGSFTANANTTVNLGYEPQWILFKNADGAFNWAVVDAMRGWTADGNFNILKPNLSDAEGSETGVMKLTSTGFQWVPAVSGNTYIYIAIRRGPMKTPTVGTSVFAPVTATAPASPYTVTTNFPVDLSINSLRNTSAGKSFNDRLRGGSTTSFVGLNSTSTAVENIASGYGLGFQSNTSIIDKDWQSGTGANPIYWNFRRAPGFFDEVCYTGTGSATTFTHNLGVAPEMMIVKGRSSSSDWMVYTATDGPSYYYWLNDTSARRTADATIWNSTAPTSSVFSVGTVPNVNGSGTTYVAYLFATVAGVSKVGSYTGNGTTQTINCGFTGGARFVLIKQTNSSGSWFTYDTARGMTVLTDPYLRLNNTGAEVATLGSVTTVSTGFALDSNILPDINFNADTYIFLAIA
jgi:hypothetical protein